MDMRQFVGEIDKKRNNMGFPRANIVDAGDVRIATYERGAKDAPPVLLIHGWPEIAYSWKH